MSLLNTARQTALDFYQMLLQEKEIKLDVAIEPQYLASVDTKILGLQKAILSASKEMAVEEEKKMQKESALQLEKDDSKTKQESKELMAKSNNSNFFSVSPSNNNSNDTAIELSATQRSVKHA